MGEACIPCPERRSNYQARVGVAMLLLTVPGSGHAWWDAERLLEPFWAPVCGGV